MEHLTIEQEIRSEI